MVETSTPVDMAERVAEAQRWLLGFIKRSLDRTGLSKRGAALRAGLRQEAIQSIYQGHFPSFATVAALASLFEEPVPFSEEEWEHLRRGRGRRERRKPRITLHCQGYMENGQQRRSRRCKMFREFIPGAIASDQRRGRAIDLAEGTYRCLPCCRAAQGAAKRKERETIYCAHCGDPISASPSRAKSRPFCSRLCYTRSRMSPRRRGTEIQRRVWYRLSELRLSQQGFECQFDLPRGRVSYILHHDDYRPTLAKLPKLAEALGWTVKRLLDATGGCQEERSSKQTEGMMARFTTLYPPGSRERQEVARKAHQTLKGKKRPPEVVERIKAGKSAQGRDRSLAALRAQNQTPRLRIRSGLQGWVSAKGRLPSDQELHELAEGPARRLGLTVKATLSMMRDMLHGPRGGRPREEKRFALVDPMVKKARAQGKRAFWNDIATAVAAAEGRPPHAVDAESLRRWYADASSRPERIAESLIRLTPRKDLWTNEECDTLRRLWPNIDAMMSALPARSRSDIRHKGLRLGLSSLRDAKGGQ